MEIARAHDAEHEDERADAQHQPAQRLAQPVSYTHLFHQFFTIPALVCGLLALALGFLLALPRRLKVGRGFWGKLPLELYAGAVLLLAVGVVEAAGYLMYLLQDDSLPRALRTLFFLDEVASETLALFLLFALFWCCLLYTSRCV